MVISNDEEIIKQLMENIEKEKQSKMTNNEIELRKISKDAKREEYRRRMIKEVWLWQTGREMFDVEYIEYIDLIEPQPSGMTISIKGFGQIYNLRTYADYKNVVWRYTNNDIL